MKIGIWSFSAILSLILVIAKIAGLITLGWLVCLAPYIIVTGVKIVLEIILVLASKRLITRAIEAVEDMEDD